MRDETYKIAYEEANAELRDILTRFEELRLRKDQIEHVVDALRPFIGMEMETAALTVVPEPEAEQEIAPEPVVYSYLQAVGQADEAIQSQPERMTAKARPISEPVAEPVAYAAMEPSSDPFQRRIDDALWGWRRPATLMSTT